MDIVYVVILSYLCGSIPFGLIFTKTFSDKDLRKVGSGNIGATNVLRTGKKFLAACTLIFDVAKGYVPVIIAQKYFPELVHLACLITFLGHIFPVWLKFNGGKGVATYLGILIALSYGLSILFIFTWIVVTLIFKYSSVSSMFAAMTVFVVTLIKETALTPFDLNYSDSHNLKIILLIFFILIVFTHRKNIMNLKNSKETKIKI